MSYHGYIKRDYKNLIDPSLQRGHGFRARRWWVAALGLSMGFGVAASVLLSAGPKQVTGEQPQALVSPPATPTAPEPRVVKLILPGQDEAVPAPLQARPDAGPVTKTIALARPETPADPAAPPEVATLPAPSATASAELPLALASVDTETIHQAIPAPAEPAAISETAETAALKEPAIADAPVRPQAMQLTVKKGDTLSSLFERAGVSQGQMYALLATKDLRKRFRRLKPSQSLSLQVDAEQQLESLLWTIDEGESLKVTRTDKGFEAETLKTELEVRQASASGIVTHSLFGAGQEAGLSDRLIMEMVNILGWDIDFALDIREGDSFRLVYEELYNEEGEKVRDGKILAAQFTNQGRKVVGLRYTAPDDGHVAYYSPDGHAMRKAFLRTPVNFARISSRFSTGRRHPVLNRIRAHKGVDYAAATGTPIKAAGDGKVIFRGRKGGYGNTIILQHGSQYTTLYAHMSRYAKSARKGRRVKQGQTIGYVGKSGLATGPHLHYEFRVNGVHRDPLTVKLPKALPLAKKYRKDFMQKSKPLLAYLESLPAAHVALNQ